MKSPNGTFIKTYPRQAKHIYNFLRDMFILSTKLCYCQISEDISAWGGTGIFILVFVSTVKRLLDTERKLSWVLIVNRNYWLLPGRVKRWGGWLEDIIWNTTSFEGKILQQGKRVNVWEICDIFLFYVGYTITHLNTIEYNLSIDSILVPVTNMCIINRRL
jgi:hypothetical protein